MDPFDAHAATYDREWETDPVALLQRRRVHARLAELLSPPAHVLDLGCGTGTDAAWLSRAGYRVTGVDRSPEMLARARAKAPDATLAEADLSEPEGLPEGPFDAVLSNFGPLNCAPLPAVARALATRLRPGAPVVIVVLSRRCPAEALALLAAGHPREALSRRRRRYAPVAGAPVPIRYLRISEVRRAFAPWFELRDVAALGALLPPPGSSGRRFHPFAAALDRLDARVARWPILRSCGDHTMFVFTAAAAPSPPGSAPAGRS